MSGEILARSGEGWKSGPIGFAVILVLCVACYFLFKSMSMHMRRVREEFPTATTPLPTLPDPGAGSPASAASQGSTRAPTVIAKPAAQPLLSPASPPADPSPTDPPA